VVGVLWVSEGLLVCVVLRLPGFGLLVVRVLGISEGLLVCLQELRLGLGRLVVLVLGRQTVLGVLAVLRVLAFSLLVRDLLGVFRVLLVGRVFLVAMSRMLLVSRVLLVLVLGGRRGLARGNSGLSSSGTAGCGCTSSGRGRCRSRFGCIGRGGCHWGGGSVRGALLESIEHEFACIDLHILVITSLKVGVVIVVSTSIEVALIKVTSGVFVNLGNITGLNVGDGGTNGKSEDRRNTISDGRSENNKVGSEFWNFGLREETSASRLRLNGPRIYLRPALRGCPRTTIAWDPIAYPVPPSVITVCG
jgi:hypothetical protein